MLDDLWAALGLALVIEGLLYAVAPDGMRRALESVLGQPTEAVRLTGLGAVAAGLLVVWLVRG